MWPQWMNMLGTAQWALLLAIPPAIVLLYFLKLKRQPLQVPSTYLWHRTVEDLHVNTIWQRLRQNLLLFLQLLLLALAILALLRPTWQGTRLTGDRFIFLVDNSASMAASDVRPTRLARAKQHVRELIEQMRSGDVAMIVSFADDARVVQQFTDNRRELLERLDAIEQTETTTSLDEALRVAAGLANPGRSASDPSDTQVADALPATVYIFSDGKFPDVQNFSLGNLKPEFRPLGDPDVTNVAVVAFEARRNQELLGDLQAFARLENFGPEREVTASLYADDSQTPLDAKRVKLPARGSGGADFQLPQMETAVLRLVVDVDDGLKLDNQAWTVINPPRRGKVLLVTPGNSPLEIALATEDARKMAEVTIAGPDQLAQADHQKKAAEGFYDLIIYDRCRPQPPAEDPQGKPRMPQSNTLFIGELPPADMLSGNWSVREQVTAPQIIDIERSHPLMGLIELGDVIIAEATPLVPPQGASVLVDTNQGPLLAVAPRQRFEDAVLGAEIVSSRDGEAVANTTWPLRVSFPVFVLNVLQYLGGGEQTFTEASSKPGEQVALRSDSPAERLQVRTPAGKRIEVPPGPQGAFHFAQTESTGVYEVLQDGKLIDRFAVNLFSSGESDIEPRPENAIKIGYVAVEGERAAETKRREGWKPLLLGALAVLLTEWYIYNRRVYF